MTPTFLVWIVGLAPAFGLGWFGGTLTERRKRMTESSKSRKILTRDTVSIGIVVTALVLAVIAAVYSYGSESRGTQRDESNFQCLADYVSTGQKNSAPATLANRAQSAAWRDYQRGYSVDPAAKGMDSEALKVRWLALYKVYEDVQTPPLPDLRKFCADRKN